MTETKLQRYTSQSISEADINGKICKLDISTVNDQETDKPVKRVIVFDWDDTIFPTSFVIKSKIADTEDLPPHLQSQSVLKELCEYAEKALIEAAKHGEVIIITSAGEGWVEYSAAKFLPKLIPVLDGIKVVSARSRYDNFYSLPLCWKARTFADEVNEIFNNNSKGSSFDDDSTSSTSSCSTLSTVLSERHQREIISFGDSMDERTAVKVVASQLNTSSKSIKFIQQPSPIQIIGQLSIITSQLAHICDDEEDIDVEISEPHAVEVAESILNKVRKSNKNENVESGYKSNVTGSPLKSKSTFLCCFRTRTRNVASRSIASLNYSVSKFLFHRVKDQTSIQQDVCLVEV
uniref:Uncharacterized protein n=1 Tax=Corethron hystrix TaxID=216773 RepID=A0A7S1FMK9_9STRA|mmetsp:Transcript_16331/g.36752  ORF Transcript_16331/g.36752 Transcript_16331/m.36752 type:complete len:349 (+) Transcript_16331:319-1365(+)